MNGSSSHAPDKCDSPQRIVSLLPAATEWICTLGLQDRLVAVSHQCDYPPAVAQLPVVTDSHVWEDLSSREIHREVSELAEAEASLYRLDWEQLESLRPDLIVTQTLCSVCAVSRPLVDQVVERLPHACRVLDLAGHTFSDVMKDAACLVQQTGSQEESVVALKLLHDRIQRVRDSAAGPIDRPRVTLLEWTDPLFSAGHWTPELISWAGGLDPVGQIGQRSRTIEWDELCAADPDLLLVACCGFDLQRNHQELERLGEVERWRSLRAVTEGRVHVFDGSAWFNRPGPRLIDALESVAGLVAQWHESQRPSR